METVLRNIRTDLRLSMDGAVAASMRQMGVKFRMIFGVGVPRLTEISKKYDPNVELAERLWLEDVRELKILATMLFPLHEMTREVAHRWGEGIINQEIREQACKNLFQSLPFAADLIEKWTINEDDAVRATGYWLFARLCITRSLEIDTEPVEKMLTRAIDDLKGESPLLYQSALNALRFYGRSSKERSNWVLRQVEAFRQSTLPREREMYEQLFHEFEYIG